MHPPPCRDAVSSSLIFVLLTFMPQPQRVAIADSPDHSPDRSPGAVVVLAQRSTDLDPTGIAGSARRPPTEAQPTGQSSRVGGQPQPDLVAQAAYGEVVAEPLPKIFRRQNRSEATSACDAAFGEAGEAKCGIKGCLWCSGDSPNRRIVPHDRGAADLWDAAEQWRAAEQGNAPGGWAAAERGDASSAGDVSLGNSLVAEPVCQAGCQSGDATFLCLPIPRINWCRFEFFSGVQSFAGPANYAGVGTEPTDRAGSSSFGVHHGMNGTRPLALLDNQASVQLGIRGVQSDFGGADFTDNSRRQIFVTGGFFRRVDYGLQGGVVADYLHDDWYYELNLTQLRGEISWKTGPCNEFGYGYMAGLSDDASPTTIATGGGTFAADRIAMEAVNQNRLFYRRHFREGGFAEAFGGISGDDDGLLGASLELPLRSAFSLRSGVTYLIPETSDEQRDHQEESWNVGISLVWYPCGGCGSSRYQRPLMNVADNGTFMVDRQ